MIIYPAIDLRNGRCVRLRQGDPKAETVFGEEPTDIARQWVAQGAEWLHIVNLDGAFGELISPTLSAGGGSPVRRLAADNSELSTANLSINLQALSSIRKAVEAKIQFGGGLRTLADIELLFSLGVDRVVLGTVAVKNPELVRTAVRRWGTDSIVVGIDARNGKVAIHGWQEESQVDAVDLAHQMKCLGVKRIVFTDISRDGMLEGVNVSSTSNLGDMTDLKVIASGGVASLADIRRLKRHEHYNIEGVIIGQALYTGKIDLAAAIVIGQAPLFRSSAGIVPYRWKKPETTHATPEVLLLWNSFFEQWQFPRGGVEEGETVWDCAQREFSLETGLPVVQMHEQAQTILQYMTQIRDYEIERHVTYFLAETSQGEARLGHDNHSEYRWVGLDQAKLMLMDTSPEQLPALDMAVRYFHSQQH